MKFTDERLYVLGIGTAYMTDPATGDILFWSDKFQEGNVNFSASDNVLSAGIGNGPAIIIPTDPNITVNVTAAEYSEYVKAASVGAAITQGAPVMACREVTAEGTNLTVDLSVGTPVAGLGMDKAVCYVQEVGGESPVYRGGKAYELDTATGAVAGFAAESGKRYAVSYFTTQANATLTTVTTNVKGRVVRFVFSQPVYTGYDPATNSGDFWGWLHTVVPRLQLMPSGGGTDGSQTAFTVTGITGRAMAQDAAIITEECKDCGFTGLPMMYRILEPCDGAEIDGVLGIIGGYIQMSVGETVQLDPTLIVDGTLHNETTISDFFFTSTNGDVADVGPNDGEILGISSGNAKIQIDYTVPDSGKTFTDFVNVQVIGEDELEWKFTCKTGVNVYVAGEDLSIDFGDGSTETIGTSSTMYHVSHTYSDSEVHQVTLYGLMSSVYFYNWNYDTSAVRQYLQSVDTPIPRNNITYADGMFAECRALQFVPANLFEKCRKITSLQTTFAGCKSLAAIPNGLLDNCTNVIDFSNTFQGCSALIEIPFQLFAKCKNVSSFFAVFSDCTGLTEIPADLFEQNENADSMASVFMGCKSIRTIPPALFEKCLKVKNFSAAFSGCTSLTAIPNELFGNCTAVTTFQGVFRNCTSLTAIPNALFDNCASVKDYSNAFRNDSGIMSFVPELWNTEKWPNVTTKSNCFNGCINAQNYADIPAAWK